MMIRRYRAILIAAYFINYSQEVIKKIKHSFGRVFDDDRSTILQAISSKKTLEIDVTHFVDVIKIRVSVKINER